MALFPPRLFRMKFQFAVIHRTMATLTNIANPNATASPLLAIGQGSGAESHRVPNSLNWKPAAGLGIAQVAEFRQFLLRWNRAFVAGRRAVPTPTASERKALGVQPGSPR